jgi:protein arginine kinase
MKVADLAKNGGEWLRGAGPESDIVISSRIRLARNLAGFPFVSKAGKEQKTDVADLLRDRISAARLADEVIFFDLNECPDLDRQLLVERHLISKNHADAEGSRSVCITPTETLSIMINEEDHLRIQVLRSGLQLEESWEQINRIDDLLESRLDYAFSGKFGFLTACPTNVGTGIRVSVMLHLPALKLTGEMERVLRAARDMKLAIRGLYGEGTEATGDFYQVSNQLTLGKSEREIIHNFKNVVIPRIIEFEKTARQTLLTQREAALDDKIYRALGTLRHARQISSEETLFLLSAVRLGVNLNRLSEVDIRAVNELFVQSQPAHLQALHGDRLTGEERSIVRANFIRGRLNGH